MRYIPISQGKYAIVDDADFEWLSKYRWYCCWSPHKKTYYAQTSVKIDSKHKCVFMHRMILNAPKGKQTDHENGKGYDNRRENIKICTASENQHNQHAVRGRSKYHGVSWNKASSKWRAKIMYNGTSYYLGLFDLESDAANAYESKKQELKKVKSVYG